MQGGVHPDLKIDYYERLLSGIGTIRNSLPLFLAARNFEHRAGIDDRP
jgi:2-iminoacetate synthase ThiH